MKKAVILSLSKDGAQACTLWFDRLNMTFTCCGTERGLLYKPFLTRTIFSLFRNEIKKAPR
jgi:hypothetical protein